jgi:Ca2+-binding RTX toxin-like protein
VVAGGPGDDVLESIAPPDVGCGYLGEDAEAVARGGRGDDTLVGEYMPDILIGGRGNDFANGRRNVDRCVAETEIRCDR